MILFPLKMNSLNKLLVNLTISLESLLNLISKIFRFLVHLQ